MSGYKGLNNPSTNDLLKNHMNAITNTSRSARLYGRLFALQDTALFVVNKLKEKSFELKDLQKFITDEIEKTHKQIDESEKRTFGNLSNGHSNGSLTNQK
jgi:hypothetical protein|tara:strand:+ start:1054 stop:1353 length:300 start_codon:yes stop_codon:yes gene_type:complete